MPDWLVELCVGRPRRRERRATTAGRHARFRWPEALDGVHEGRRHTSIFLMASSLRGQGTPEAVVRELALVAAVRCRPPLPPAEALAVLDDVFDRYATNASRARTLSEERIDVLAVLATAVSPLQPAAVALLLGKNREAIKQLMVKMLRDDQVRRVPGGYGLSIPATSTNISHFPVAGAANETPLHPAQHAPRTRL
jgi:hypothetical protein